MDPEIVIGGLQGQNYFHNNNKMLFVFSTVLTFPVVVMQNQWWMDKTPGTLT